MSLRAGRSPRLVTPMALAGLLLASAGPTRGDNDPAVQRAVQYLRGSIVRQGTGESALIALAMIKAEVPATDPAVAACLARIRARVSTGGYNPERTGGLELYEAAVGILALANAVTESRPVEVDALARFLIGRQNPNGSWDYTVRTQGDTSISQYAVLGLWEADNAGARVPPEVFDRAARWYLSAQKASGAWTYHSDEPQYHETVAMAAAGVGSLLICQRQLAKARHGSAGTNPLLTPLGGEVERARAPYNPSVSNASIDQGVKRGLAWLGAHFTTAKSDVVGPSAFYALYGIERIGALADREALGQVNWYDAGRAYLASSQQQSGAWNANFGAEPNTAWAILFLTKSTAKSIRRIEVKRLGAGTLLGGRGLPSDLSSLTVAGGRIISRPMNGAVEGMLAVLEDPRAQAADSALAGLVERYQSGGPDVLRPHKDRFRKLLEDRDPGLRRVAAWALGRTGDLDVAPALIAALTDADQSVVDTARMSLQLLSRKIDGLGPPSPSTPAQRAEASRRWKDWYQSIRPLDEEEESGDLPATLRPSPSKPPTPRSAR